jgi:hypothetical protein
MSRERRAPLTTHNVQGTKKRIKDPNSVKELSSITFKTFKTGPIFSYQTVLASGRIQVHDSISHESASSRITHDAGLTQLDSS